MMNVGIKQSTARRERKTTLENGRAFTIKNKKRVISNIFDGDGTSG